ncbi:hypothetical protein R69658_02096 [Paraburkholderia aspalathi]|uniref:Uncharacterized protein n=1 Tax=Paraburkholderia aspalathi TaxID=1324617 RepID=A0ABM8R7F5_9BURK|nr:hypothetical protein R69658_02096 [Paraburkholderia aspalathi]
MKVQSIKQSVNLQNLEDWGKAQSYQLKRPNSG